MGWDPHRSASTKSKNVYATLRVINYFSSCTPYHKDETLPDCHYTIAMLERVDIPSFTRSSQLGPAVPFSQ